MYYIRVWDIAKVLRDYHNPLAISRKSIYICSSVECRCMVETGVGYNYDNYFEIHYIAYANL